MMVDDIFVSHLFPLLMRKSELDNNILDHPVAVFRRQFKPCFVYNAGGPVTNR